MQARLPLPLEAIPPRPSEAWLNECTPVSILTERTLQANARALDAVLAEDETDPVKRRRRLFVALDVSRKRLLRLYAALQWTVTALPKLSAMSDVMRVLGARSRRVAEASVFFDRLTAYLCTSGSAAWDVARAAHVQAHGGRYLLNPLPPVPLDDDAGDGVDDGVGDTNSARSDTRALANARSVTQLCALRDATHLPPTVAMRVDAESVLWLEGPGFALALVLRMVRRAFLRERVGRVEESTSLTGTVSEARWLLHEVKLTAAASALSAQQLRQLTRRLEALLLRRRGFVAATRFVASVALATQMRLVAHDVSQNASPLLCRLALRDDEAMRLEVHLLPQCWLRARLVIEPVQGRLVATLNISDDSDDLMSDHVEDRSTNYYQSQWHVPQDGRMGHVLMQATVSLVSHATRRLYRRLLARAHSVTLDDSTRVPRLRVSLAPSPQQLTLSLCAHTGRIIALEEGVLAASTRIAGDVRHLLRRLGDRYSDRSGDQSGGHSSAHVADGVTRVVAYAARAAQQHDLCVRVSLQLCRLHAGHVATGPATGLPHVARCRGTDGVVVPLLAGTRQSQQRVYLHYCTRDTHVRMVHEVFSSTDRLRHRHVSCLATGNDGDGAYPLIDRHVPVLLRQARTRLALGALVIAGVLPRIDGDASDRADTGIDRDGGRDGVIASVTLCGSWRVVLRHEDADAVAVTVPEAGIGVTCSTDGDGVTRALRQLAAAARVTASLRTVNAAVDQGTFQSVWNTIRTQRTLACDFTVWGMPSVLCFSDRPRGHGMTVRAASRANPAHRLLVLLLDRCLQSLWSGIVGSDDEWRRLERQCRRRLLQVQAQAAQCRAMWHQLTRLVATLDNNNSSNSVVARAFAATSLGSDATWPVVTVLPLTLSQARVRFFPKVSEALSLTVHVVTADHVRVTADPSVSPSSQSNGVAATIDRTVAVSDLNTALLTELSRTSCRQWHRLARAARGLDVVSVSFDGSPTVAAAAGTVREVGVRVIVPTHTSPPQPSPIDPKQLLVAHMSDGRYREVFERYVSGVMLPRLPLPTGRTALVFHSQLAAAPALMRLLQCAPPAALTCLASVLHLELSCLLQQRLSAEWTLACRVRWSSRLPKVTEDDTLLIGVLLVPLPQRSAFTGRVSLTLRCDLRTGAVSTSASSSSYEALQRVAQQSRQQQQQQQSVSVSTGADEASVPSHVWAVHAHAAVHRAALEVAHRGHSQMEPAIAVKVVVDALSRLTIRVPP